MAVQIVDALATGLHDDALAITFEYLAVTQAEAGRPVPQDIQALPAVLRTVLETLKESHRPPGVLLLALVDGEVAGAVAMRPSTMTRRADAMVQRLYVRPEHRRLGIARTLMTTVHDIADRRGFDCLVLNVMTSRTGALALYESLGYGPMAEPPQWSWGGQWLRRDVRAARR